MKVRTQTNLVRRGSVLYFRKKVPQDLRAHYGQESIRQSLRQYAAQTDAKREAGRLAAHYDAEFETIRQSLKPSTALTLTLHIVQWPPEGNVNQARADRGRPGAVLG